MSVEERLIEPIDFCIILCGDNPDVLWTIFWDSLTRCCSLDGLRFHLIDKGIRSEILYNIQSAIGERGILTQVYKFPQRMSEDDVERTCDYVLNQCGDCKWACLPHLDIWFKNDWLAKARSYISDNVAMIGHHCAIMMVNRTAYRRSKIKFLRTPTCDTGLLFEQEMRETGWSVESFEDFMNEGHTDASHEWFHHIGGGGSHYSSRDMVMYRQSYQRIIDAWLKLRRFPNYLDYVVHYTWKAEDGWKIACLFNAVDLSLNSRELIYRRSNNWKYVNCPWCIGSTRAAVECAGVTRREE